MFATDFTTEKHPELINGEMLTNPSSTYGGNLVNRDQLDSYMRQSIYGTNFTTINNKTKLSYLGTCENYSIKVHRRWALIVANNDATDNDLEWGMSQSAGYSTEDGTVPNFVVGTCPVDGLLNTRIFDDTSIERANWFQSLDWKGDYTFDYGDLSANEDGIFDAFKHTGRNLMNMGWDSTVSPENWKNTDGTYDIEKWRVDYEKMWNYNNPENTAINQVSNINKTQSINGVSTDYSDWYIPSSSELNIIYNAAQNGLNASILVNGGTPMVGKRYWSSTTANNFNSVTQAYEGIDPMLEEARDWDYTSDYVRTAGHAHSMIYQDFNTGRTTSTLRRNGEICSLRVCRRIPVYTIELDTYIRSEIGGCSSCDSQECTC